MSGSEPGALPLDPAGGERPRTRPTDEYELRSAVGQADSDGRPLEILGGGSKRGWGRPVEASQVLCLDRLTGVIDYEPSELVLTARPATPMRELEALLDAHNQVFLFEPPDWGEHATLGGTIACNVAGPRRVRAGAARDHFLGFRAVDGTGEAWKGGGKVVKNVTGYDMCKLQAGAFGTLSVLTEISVRVMPRPETVATVLFSGLSDEEAVALMARALNTPHEVSAAVHLPPAAARRTGFPSAATGLRLEGPPGSVVYRAGAIASLAGRAELLDAGATRTLFEAVAAPGALLGDPAVLWRLHPTPSRSALVGEAIRRAFASAQLLYDWGGGLLWAALGEDLPDAGAATIRSILRDAGGSATLFNAPDHVRRGVPVFDPPEPALAALTARIKAGFDPRRILNRGRMQEGL